VPDTTRDATGHRRAEPRAHDAGLLGQDHSRSLFGQCLAKVLSRDPDLVPQVEELFLGELFRRVRQVSL
jgi:hypothetical protein